MYQDSLKDSPRKHPWDDAVTTRVTFNFDWKGGHYRVQSDGKAITVYVLTSDSIGSKENLVFPPDEAHEVGLWILRGRKDQRERAPEYMK